MASKKQGTAPAKSWEHVCGTNVALSVEGDFLTVVIDLSKSFGLSASGKTFTVASTSGFVNVPTHEGTVVSLNVNRKK